MIFDKQAFMIGLDNLMTVAFVIFLWRKWGSIYCFKTWPWPSRVVPESLLSLSLSHNHGIRNLPHHTHRNPKLLILFMFLHPCFPEDPTWNCLFFHDSASQYSKPQTKTHSLIKILFPSVFILPFFSNPFCKKENKKIESWADSPSPA